MTILVEVLEAVSVIQGFPRKKKTRKRNRQRRKKPNKPGTEDLEPKLLRIQSKDSPLSLLDQIPQEIPNQILMSTGVENQWLLMNLSPYKT